MVEVPLPPPRGVRVKTAEFIKSSVNVEQCPPPRFPEFAGGHGRVVFVCVCCAVFGMLAVRCQHAVRAEGSRGAQSAGRAARMTCTMAWPPSTLSTWGSLALPAAGSSGSAGSSVPCCLCTGRNGPWLVGCPAHTSTRPHSLLPLPVIGRSNVGKSSLINLLTGRSSLAMVSKTPGGCCAGGWVLRAGGGAGGPVTARAAKHVGAPMRCVDSKQGGGTFCAVPSRSPSPRRHPSAAARQPLLKHRPQRRPAPPPPAAGKTRCINHFLINGAWYLVDLPGYG